MWRYSIEDMNGNAEINRLKKLGWKHYNETRTDAITGKFKDGVSHLKKPIVVARDIIGFNGKVSKLYLGIDSYEELLELTMNDENIYELASRGDYENITERLCYVDIDEYKKDPITETEMEAVVEDYINEFNEEVKDNKVSITKDDVIILLNNDYKTELVKSLHLIVMGYSMDYLEQRQLVKNMIYKRNADGKTERYDSSQYSAHQQVRMTNQSKISAHGEPKNYSLIVYGDDAEKNNPRNALIHHPDKCKKLHYKTSLTQTIKKIYIDTDREQVNLSKNTFSIVLDKLDSNFWNKTGYWKIATWIIHSKKLMKMETWERESRQRASNIYTKANNDQLIKDIPEVVDAGIPKLLNIFNASSSKYYFTMEFDRHENDKELLQNYITENKLPIDINKLKETLSKHKKLTLHDKRYDINLSNGFITDKIEFTTKNFKHKFANEDEQYAVRDVEHISDIDPDNIINSGKKLHLIRSAWATGKSHHIIKPLVNQLVMTKSFLIFTPLNTINNKLFADYADFNAVSHLSNGNMMTANIVICSIQSIWRIAERTFDYIILDEYEAIMDAFAGDNFGSEMNKTGSDCITHFKKKCADAEKIIFLDADLNSNRVKLLKDAIKYQAPITIINNKQNNYNEYSFEIIKSKLEFIADIEKRINDNKKVVISTSIREKFGDVLYNDWCVKFPDKNICYIHRDGVWLSLNIGGKDKHLDKNEFIQNLEFYLDKYNINIWIYTPTISVGISINDYQFDYGFSYGFHLTLPALQFLQSLFRARQLTMKHITILLEKECWTSAVPITTEQMRYYIDNKVKTYSKYYVEYYKKNQTIDEFYIRNFCYSKTLQENSRRNFGAEFIKLLETHDLKYTFRCDEKKVKILESSYAETKKKLEDEKEDQYNKQLISDFQIHRETKLKVKAENIKMPDQDDPNKLTEVEKQTYIKTNNTFYLGNTKNVIDITFPHENEETEIDIKALIQSCIPYENDVWDYDGGGDDDTAFYVEDKTEESKMSAYLHSNTDELDGIDTWEEIKDITIPYLNSGITDISGINIDNIISSYTKSKNITKVIESRRTYEMWNDIKQNASTIEDQLQSITDKQESLFISNGNRIKLNSFILIKILTILKSDNLTPTIITNIQFRDVLVEHKELTKEIYSIFSAKFSKKEQDIFDKWIDNYDNKTNSAVDKKNVKIIYHLIKDLLDDYDIGLSYATTNHSSRDNDKMVLQPKNQVVDYGGSRMNVFGKITRPFKRRVIAEIDCPDVNETFYVKRILEDDRCSEAEYKLSKDKEHLVISKVYGRTLRIKLYKKKKELFALESGRKSNVDEATGAITYRANETSYRPYQVKMTPATLILRNRITTRNLAEVIESIKNLNCISKMNNNRFIQVNKHITDDDHPTPNAVFEKWNQEHITLVNLQPEGLLGENLDMSCYVRHDIQECYDTQQDDHYHNFIITRWNDKLTGRKMWGKALGDYTDAERERWTTTKNVECDDDRDDDCYDDEDNEGCYTNIKIC